MIHSAVERFLSIAKEPAVYRQTVSYLCERLAPFITPDERVLLCFSEEEEYGPGTLLEHALRELEAVPIYLEPNYSWQSLMRQAFFSRATALVGPPLIVLGLTKVAKATGTPLNIRDVLLVGAPCEDWMIDGIQNGLDAGIWGCYDPIPGLVVGGFSCGMSTGVHIRSDALSVETVDENGNSAPEGRIVIRAVSDPAVRLVTGQRGRLVNEPCPCGNPHPRLKDFAHVKEPDPSLDGLQELLLSWSSVLDYRASRTEMGMELEVVAFPGQRLPKLPTCARLKVRPWIAKHDKPFCLENP